MADELKSFKVGKVYSFNTHVPDELGIKITNVRCLAIMDANNAIQDGMDIIALHERMRPHLPTGHNDDPYTMTYVKVRNSSGLETIYSLSWINLTTLEEVEDGRILIDVRGVSLEDIEALRSMLISRGYSNISLKFASD